MFCLLYPISSFDGNRVIQRDNKQIGCQLEGMVTSLCLTPSERPVTSWTLLTLPINLILLNLLLKNIVDDICSFVLAYLI